MPRIAFILEDYYGDAIGGAERQVQMLGEALREVRWETSYICQRKADKPRRETVDGMDVIALPDRKRSLTLLNYAALSKAMGLSGADVFYQRVRRPFTGMAARIAKRLRKPLVFAAASRADVVRDVDLRAQNKDRPRLDKLLYPFNRHAEDWGMLHVDTMIMQTLEQALLLQQHYRREGIVIPNHIKVCSFPPLVNDKKTVIWVSNIKPLKRPELFIELARRCRDLDAEFKMVGGCPSGDTRQQINAAVQELKNFDYLGPLEPEQAEERIAGSALLVNTSTFEGFPNAFQQAWAHGVPTLSLGIDPDGVIERHRLGGSFDSLEGLEKALRRILSDDEARKETGSRAREFALKSYDISHLLPQYLELFESLLQA
ncbi:glycosyltransferase family 4 protein [bacterium]|nr:glycosyltransferase family 4 protein [bacterium]